MLGAHGALHTVQPGKGPRGEVPVRGDAAGMTRHHESYLGPTINL